MPKVKKETKVYTFTFLKDTVNYSVYKQAKPGGINSWYEPLSMEPANRRVQEITVTVTPK